MNKLPLAIAPLLLLFACGEKVDTRTPSLPAPTEHRLDDDAERLHKKERKAWIEEMHLAAPGVDWREIEAANGEMEMKRRGEIVSGGEKSSRSGSWSEVGSRNLAGRMHCARLGPGAAGERKLYAGSSLGGLWRGDPDGTGWEPLGNNLYGGAHEVLVLPGEFAGDPDVLLAATDGGSVHVTRDLGATWEVPAGLPNFSSIRGVEQAGEGISTWYVLGRYGSTTALYASADYGRTFVQRWSDGTAWSGSLWVPRAGVGNGDHVYLLHKSSVRFSSDGGWNFTQLGTPAAGTKGVLTGCAAGSPTLYVALAVGGQWKLYRSGDGGHNFSYKHDIGDFWESLCASTLDPDLVVFAGVEAWRSTDGGGSFNKINSWGSYYGDPANKLHADLPGVYCTPDPDTPATDEIWHFCTDGGLYESTDLGATVQNLSLSGLGVSQYYSTLSSSVNPDRIAAGAQDQGYQRGILQPSSEPGPSTDFNQLISGDYGHLTSSDHSHALVYSTYPGFILVQRGEYNVQLHTADFPSGSSHLWLPPVVADPTDYESFFFLGRYLYRYKRAGGNYWNYVQHSSQDFTVGGGSYLSALAFAPGDPQRVYAFNNSGRSYNSTDAGVTWQLSSEGGPNSHYFYGNSLAVDPNDPLHAFVGGSGYSGGAVFRTTDGGVHWSNASSGLPSTLVYDLAFAGDGSGDLYAAANAGAYRWTSVTGTWENIMGNEAPITLYWSIEAVPGRPVMRFGTYGRGIWDYEFDACDQMVSYCFSAPNSTGNGAVISSVGAPSVAGNDFHLVATDCPSNQFMMFYYGSAPSSTVFGNGWRCVNAGGVGIFRFKPFLTDGIGTGLMQVDFTQPPAGTGGGLGEWAVGELRYCQGWYRDPAGGGAQFNLTDGLRVMVCP